MITATVDTAGLDFVLNGVKHALTATGGDVSELTKDESRLLAMQLMKLNQPQDKKKTEADIDRNVRSAFLDLDNDNTKFWENLKYQNNSESGVQWYRATKSFLYGVDEAKDLRKAGADTIKDVYFASANNALGRSEKARLVYDFKKPRQHQKVAILRQIIVSKASLARGIKLIQASVGKLAASWLATAKTIDSSSKGPAFVERQFKNGTQTSKSITDLSGLSHLESPSVTFGSKARGAASKRGKQQVQFAMKVREQKLTARLKLILSGYSKDVAQGIKVARHAHQVKGQP